jgi:hypothetical protein
MVSAYLGPFTGAIYVESQPGKVHEFQPQTAQWVKERLQGLPNLPKDKSIVATVTTGSGSDSNLSLRFGAICANASENGANSIRFVGICENMDKAKVSKNGSAFALNQGDVVGVLEETAPNLQESTGGTMSRTSGVFSSQMDAILRPGSISNRLQYESGYSIGTFDMRNTNCSTCGGGNTLYNQEYVGASYKPTLNQQYSFRKIFEIVPEHMDNTNNPSSVTYRADSQDVLDYAFVHHGVQYRARAIFAGGITQNDATGAAVSAAGNRKAIHLEGNCSAIVANRSQDSFYQQDGIYCSALIALQKEFHSKNGNIIGTQAGVRYTTSNALLPPLLPDLDPKQDLSTFYQSTLSTRDSFDLFKPNLEAQFLKISKRHTLIILRSNEQTHHAKMSVRNFPFR